ncbi:hypothetical protein Acor_78190 [Acrocarpospora corrugata]|uniref:OmpR/PhoB-type domain-containing protein n=1 Tax=Acrocarpospora corrugata TaxID=35763 RepID=A0A5M3WBY9_9ACTN|nr:AfsR/SARP family transcriptional regulator [Acrocarpospora corrugata]GES05750.1 hypothetical protein Acor_78190 [Acrocarpospora corrugata]
MDFRILGPLEAVGASGQVAKIPPRERVVLGMLLLRPERTVSVDQLVDAVWDDLPPTTARKQILICVSVLRRLLANVGFAGEIGSRPPGYRLQLGSRDRLDLQDFEALSVAGSAALREDRPGDAMEAFRQALELWRGEPLAGTTSHLLHGAAVALSERWLSVAETYADVRMRLGVRPDLIEDLRLLTASHPLRETLHSRLMRALAQAGRPVEAIEAYNTARRTFAAELGLEPGEELRRLREAILAGRQDAELATLVGVAAD